MATDIVVPKSQEANALYALGDAVGRGVPDTTGGNVNETCGKCGHSSDEHAYSDEHSKPDWMNDDGTINYATHCHVRGCNCSDWDGQGRPRAEGLKVCGRASNSHTPS